MRFGGERLGMGDAKGSSSGGQRRRVLHISCGASHTVALLCNFPFSLTHTFKASHNFLSHYVLYISQLLRTFASQLVQALNLRISDCNGFYGSRI